MSAKNIHYVLHLALYTLLSNGLLLFSLYVCMNIEYCNLMSVSLFLYNKTCVKRITEQNVRCLFHKKYAMCLKLLHESM